MLFFSENDEDFEIVKNYWAKRIEKLEESEDLPWLSKKDKEQMLKELHYLKQRDEKNKEWRDLRWLEFRLEFLDKYKNNELCKIGSDHISFLRYDKKTSASDVSFIIKDDILMVYAKEFNNVPPIERNHWNHYQIPPVETKI